MTVEGAVVLILCAGVVIGTAWVRWRLTHGPLKEPTRPDESRTGED